MDPLTKILGASVELFTQYGFKTITMDDIARKAGISKKTLYQHFANKQEVVAESIAWHKSHLFNKCQELLDNSANAVEGMVKVMNMFDEVHGKINPVAMMELQKYFPDAFRHFKEKLLVHDIEMVQKNIEWGIKEGLYREDINAEFMARYRMEISLIMFHPNLLINEMHDLQYVAYEISEHYLHGIMTQKGEKLYQKYKEQYLTQVTKL
jgi:AcrR family transcriptional regulator